MFNVPQQVGVKDTWARLITCAQEAGPLVQQTAESAPGFHPSLRDTGLTTFDFLEVVHFL